MSNNKQTAVEWLENQYIKHSGNLLEMKKSFEQAKQIEKKQIVEAARWEPFLGEMSKEVGEQYYDEKYGNSREVAQ